MALEHLKTKGVIIDFTSKAHEMLLIGYAM